MPAPRFRVSHIVFISSRSFILSRSLVAFSTMATASDSSSDRCSSQRRRRRRYCIASCRSNAPASADQFVFTPSASLPSLQSYTCSSSSSSSTHSSLGGDQAATRLRRRDVHRRWKSRPSRLSFFPFAMTSFALLVALGDIQSMCARGHKPSPPRHPRTGTNIWSLITNGRRHISARSYMAASILVASSSNGRGNRCMHRTKVRGGHANLNAGRKIKASSSSVAYNQDALIDEEATWIMEEEYRGASKREQKKQKWQRIGKKEKLSSKEEDSESSDDACWWENDPWNDGDDDTDLKKKEEKDDATKPIEEHPLRTDEWLVRIKVGGFPWSSAKEYGVVFAESSYDEVLAENDDIKVPKRADLGRRERVQRLRFSRSGLVWVVSDDSIRSDGASAKTAIGRWKLDHTGLHWDVEVAVPPPPSKAARASNLQREEKGEGANDELSQITAATVDLNAADWGSFAAIAAGGSKDAEKAGTSVEGWRTTTLNYRTDIHLNKFGERPRMFKGIITRDRYAIIGERLDDTKKAPSLFGLSLPTRTTLFRPVVATFEACGIGEDTVDLAYRERGSSATRSKSESGDR